MMIPHGSASPVHLQVLVDGSGHCKIADFGVAHHFSDEDNKEDVNLRQLYHSHSRGQMTKTEGTYYFWAPEMCDKGSFSAYAADIWAVGIVLYGMIFGTLPFTGTDPLNLFEVRTPSP